MALKSPRSARHFGYGGLAPANRTGDASEVSDAPKCLDVLDWWLDPLPRDGPHNMAVDEWLLGSVERPLLRVYHWLGDWLSLGCFVPLAQAQQQFPVPNNGMQMVRRWTGGGIVDHRDDWTYSLVIPGAWVPRLGRPRDSYERIHEALARTLAQEQIDTRVASASNQLSTEPHGACFRNPVAGDLLGSSGNKQAGAAQRRTKQGLLHQGSVRLDAPTGGHHDAARGAMRAERFARMLAATACCRDQLEIDAEHVAALVAARYGSPGWLHAR